jgi:hypothetical protein
VHRLRDGCHVAENSLGAGGSIVLGVMAVSDYRFAYPIRLELIESANSPADSKNQSTIISADFCERGYRCQFLADVGSN